MRYKSLKIIRYKEGFSYPIENNVLIDTDANYVQSLLERDVDKLWVTKKDYSELIRYALIGIGILAVIFIIMQIFKGKPPV